MRQPVRVPRGNVDLRMGRFPDLLQAGNMVRVAVGEQNGVHRDAVVMEQVHNAAAVVTGVDDDAVLRLLVLHNIAVGHDRADFHLFDLHSVPHFCFFLCSDGSAMPAVTRSTR